MQSLKRIKARGPFGKAVVMGLLERQAKCGLKSYPIPARGRAEYVVAGVIRSINQENDG